MGAAQPRHVYPSYQSARSVCCNEFLFVRVGGHANTSGVTAIAAWDPTGTRAVTPWIDGARAFWGRSIMLVFADGATSRFWVEGFLAARYAALGAAERTPSSQSKEEDG